MIETVVALLMFWNGEIKEHRIQESMAECLRARRVAEREFNPNISYKCIRSEAETEIYMGEKSIKKPLNISEEAAVQMPMKTVASLIIIVALGTMGYFQIVERLNIADTRIQLMEKDLEENTEFRIKWPRGQLGSLPADSEQFMMIEDLYKSTDKLNKHIEDMALNKVNIEFLRKQMDKVLEDIEKLKDANREFKYTNGNGQ